jgi:hypothetical protein
MEQNVAVMVGKLNEYPSISTSIDPRVRVERWVVPVQPRGMCLCIPLFLEKSFLNFPLHDYGAISVDFVIPFYWIVLASAASLIHFHHITFTLALTLL